MQRFLPLFPFVCLLLTPLYAQSDWGSGSLVATITSDGIISISISSGAEHQLIRYAPAQNAQRFPVRYRGYEPYPYGGWGDWRVIHEKVNELTSKGWELNGTNMSTSGGGECGQRLKHVHYHFYVPNNTPPLTALSARDSALGQVVLEASIDQSRDFGRQRGALLKRANGKFALVIETFQGDDYYPFVTIEDE
ncbi:MAG: hypothetical protein AAFU67_17425, partial [Bacteroidota bacterium]